MSRKHSFPPRLAVPSSHFLHPVLSDPFQTEATGSSRRPATHTHLVHRPRPVAAVTDGWRMKGQKSQCEAGALDIRALGTRTRAVLHFSLCVCVCVCVCGCSVWGCTLIRTLLNTQSTEDREHVIGWETADGFSWMRPVTALVGHSSRREYGTMTTKTCVSAPFDHSLVDIWGYERQKLKKVRWFSDRMQLKEISGVFLISSLRILTWIKYI